MQRWGKRFNWHNPALDFDQQQDQELRRELFSCRVRARKRTMDLTEKIDEKVAEAVDALKVTKVVKGEGQPDEVQLSLSPTELARLIEVSQNVQQRILGKDEDEPVYEFHVHFDAPDPAFDHEQPVSVCAADAWCPAMGPFGCGSCVYWEAVLAAPRKAREEQQRRDLEAI